MMERAKLIGKLADAIEANAEAITWAQALEVGTNPPPMNMAPMADTFRYYASLGVAGNDSASNVRPDRYYLELRQPLGPVALISAWNIPFGLLSMKVGAALVTGNTVVYRPSSSTPLDALIFAKLAQDILPAGVLNVVVGDSATCGQRLLDHPDIRKISFTGSVGVGQKVNVAAAQRLVPATLELGGKSANIVFDDCDFAKSVQRCLVGGLVNTGEFCAAGTRILVQEGIYDAFVGALAQGARMFRPGAPWQEGTSMEAITTHAQYEKVLEYIEIGKGEGAKLLCGGNALTDDAHKDGFYIEPTIFEATNDMRIAQEEIFGPVLVVIKFTDEEDAIRIANDSSYGLAGGVQTSDVGRALRVASRIECGLTWVNTYLDMPAGTAFGGYKNSGIGRELCARTLEQFTQVKSIMINASKEALI